MPLFWIVHIINNKPAVFIQESTGKEIARLKASIAGFDQGTFSEILAVLWRKRHKPSPAQFYCAGASAVRARAALAALLVCIVPELVEAHSVAREAYSHDEAIAVRTSTPSLTRSIVSMTEPSVSAFPEPILVTNLTPNIQIIQPAFESLDFICVEQAILRSHHQGSGRKGILPVEPSFVDRKRVSHSVGIHPRTDEPFHVSGREMANVSDADMAHAMRDGLPRSERIDAESLYGQISALENLSLRNAGHIGSGGGLPKLLSGGPKTGCKNGQDSGECGYSHVAVFVDKPDDPFQRNEHRPMKGGALFGFLAVFGLIGLVTYWMARKH